MKCAVLPGCVFGDSPCWPSSHTQMQGRKRPSRELRSLTFLIVTAPSAWYLRGLLGFLGCPVAHQVFLSSPSMVTSLSLVFLPHWDGDSYQPNSCSLCPSPHPLTAPSFSLPRDPQEARNPARLSSIAYGLSSQQILPGQTLGCEIKHSPRPQGLAASGCRQRR